MFYPRTGGDKNSREEKHSEIMLPQLPHEDTIRMDSNPSYALYIGQGINVDVQPNPSYDVNKPKRHTIEPEDQYDYAQSTELNKYPSQNCREDYISMESNPSYGITSNSNMGRDVIVEPNPSYGVAKSLGMTDINTALGSDNTITPNTTSGSVTKSSPQVTHEYDNDDDYI